MSTLHLHWGGHWAANSKRPVGQDPRAQRTHICLGRGLQNDCFTLQTLPQAVNRKSGASTALSSPAWLYNPKQARQEISELQKFPAGKVILKQPEHWKDERGSASAERHCVEA